MTQNQLRYQELLESKRSHRTDEQERYRTNTTNEQIKQWYNLGYLTELGRHNLVTESLDTQKVGIEGFKASTDNAYKMGNLRLSQKKLPYEVAQMASSVDLNTSRASEAREKAATENWKREDGYYSSEKAKNDSATAKNWTDVGSGIISGVRNALGVGEKIGALLGAGG